MTIALAVACGALACGRTQSASFSCLESDEPWCKLGQVAGKRSLHTAVWSGTEVLIWGGEQSQDGPDSPKLNTGLRIDPRSGRVRPMALTDAPAARYRHFAVWTGKEMLIWGGRAGSPLSDGALYDPVSDSWRPIVAGTDEHPDATVAWTGSELFVWGGRDSAGFVRSGFLYDPETSAWRAVSPVDAPDALSAAAVALRGSLILAGGAVDFGEMALTRYDIDADEWQAIASDGAVDGFGVASESLRFTHDDEAYFCRVTLECAVYSYARDEWRSFPIPDVGLGARPAWANSALALVLFGGQSSDGAAQAGAVYDLQSNAWRSLPTEGQPPARWEATLTPVNDSSLLLWGGQNETFELEQDGYVLNLDMAAEL